MATRARQGSGVTAAAQDCGHSNIKAGHTQSHRFHLSNYKVTGEYLGPSVLENFLKLLLGLSACLGSLWSIWPFVSTEKGKVKAATLQLRKLQIECSHFVWGKRIQWEVVFLRPGSPFYGLKKGTLVRPNSRENFGGIFSNSKNQGHSRKKCSDLGGFAITIW